MIESLHNFHFLRPLWLLTLPIAIVLWWLVIRSLQSTRWEHYIAKELLDALRVQRDYKQQTWRWLLLLGWCIAIIASAGPSWTKIPVPVVKNQQATIIMLDLSRSMLAQDLTPDRLTRAKYKLIDILKQQGDGQTALIAYAGDAHTVSPLTNDPRTIEALLPALHPGIMPSQGSNTEAAVELAMKLLSNAHISSGELLLLTDGVTSDAQAAIRKQMKGSHSLSILGIGGRQAIPIPVDGGGFLKSTSGEIILASVNHSELQRLAQDLGGRYIDMKANDSDLNHLLRNRFEQHNNSSNTHNTSDATTSDEVLFDRWADMGHWLALLLLPLLVLCFRKGVIYLLPIAFIALLFPTPNVQAQSSTTWQSLWKTKDQQAMKLHGQQQFSEAASTFRRKDWAGVSHYRAGDYAAAVSELDNKSDIRSIYNRGNALALKGDLTAAIQAYDQVLQQNPTHEDASYNKNLIEQLLQQQKDSQKQSDSSEKQSEQSEQSSSNEPQSNQTDKNQQGQQDQQNQDNSQQQAEQQSDEQNQHSSENQSAQRQTENQSSEDSVAQQNKPDDESSSEEEIAHDKKAQPLQQTNNSELQEQESDYALSTTPTELKDSSEQWLRNIQDDPSKLLQRKFQYQSWLRSQEQSSRAQTSKPQDQRY
ncbi:MAG: VWA domain-containing protein [Arenicella sp.]